MENIEILKKVLEQEINAEKRYAVQINKIRKAYVIRKVLDDIRQEEISHAKKVIEKIKQLDQAFDFLFLESGIISPFEGKDSINEIEKFLKIDIEKEKEAYSNYLALSQETDDLEIRKMLVVFIEDEKQHEQKVLNLIDNLEMLG